jgi:transcriptional regulator with GAF, ATPase, and Fis domain
MAVDENVFFREATLRICSSLDIETALKRCFEYIRVFIPANGMTLHILDPDLNLLKFVASVGLDQVNKRVLPLPEKGRDKRAADLQAAFLTNEGKVLILHPDKEAGLPEILEQLGTNANISLMNLILQLEGNLIGTLAIYADGPNQYTGEHARLLQLLHGPIAIAMSKALEHQEIIRLKDMLADDNRYLYNELRSVSGDEIIGSDFGLKPVMEMVRQVASLDSPVLLLGRRVQERGHRMRFTILRLARTGLLSR